MQIQYKIGLFLYILIILSKCLTNGAPSKNQSTAYYDDDYDDYEDYYEANETEAKDFKLGNRLNMGGSTTTTTSRSPLFNRKIDPPKRSNHIIEPKCPPNCSCMEDFKYIKCSYSNLTRVPPDIPNTAHIIDLSHNNINIIEAKDFANFTKVIEIKLNDNNIQNVEKDSFSGMKHLKRLLLANNEIKSLHPDTFTAAKELFTLDLSNNSILLPKDGSFLNQPSLVELICSNCTWTAIYDDTFANMSSLASLKLDGNNFKKKINTKAFTPLRNLIKLKLTDLDQDSIQELCTLLKSIDKINFKHFDVTCLELVLGYSFNESLTVATEAPKKKPTNEEETTSYTETNNNKTNSTSKLNVPITHQIDLVQIKMNETSTMLPSEPIVVDKTNSTVLTAGITIANDNTNSKNVSLTDEDKSYQVPVSEETINIMLISIMIVAIIGLAVGIICRKDIGGIKTKCCRTKKPNSKDSEQEQTPEEIPLNKLGN